VTILECDHDNSVLFTLFVQNVEKGLQLLYLDRSEPVRLKAINWRRGPSTGHVKVPFVEWVRSRDEAEVVLETRNPIVVDTFANCANLGRLALHFNRRTCAIGRVLVVFPLSEEEELKWHESIPSKAPKSAKRQQKK
jgi:hypothetical protein